LASGKRMVAGTGVFSLICIPIVTSPFLQKKPAEMQGFFVYLHQSVY